LREHRDRSQCQASESKDRELSHGGIPKEIVISAKLQEVVIP
jgi:hypothetical protein